jgi:hypothetical protein
MSKITRSFTVETGRSVAVPGYFPILKVEQDDGYSLQAIFSGMESTAAGAISLQTSVDGVTFSDYPGSGLLFNAATPTLTWEVTSKKHKFVRMVLSSPAGGSGTCTTTFFGEVFTD